ncbi:MAG: alpha/beta hydrolase [Verrucomicrobia bacterium]|nr:alpha/beta hydrolase [Verrucomicrobiota bacterium]
MKISLLRHCAWCLFAGGLVAKVNAQEPANAATSETVVLLHGLYGAPLMMKRLEWTFRRQGYHVVNLAYPTWRVPLETAVESHLHSSLTSLTSAGTGQVHFVTHSMGGIALRMYLARHNLPNLGRVVMLAPPNQGSKLAHLFKGSAFARWVLGPNLARLGTAPEDLPQRAGPMACEFGIIAGDGSLLSKWFDPAHPGDGRVSVESTKLAGMADHLVLPVRHRFMMCQREVCAQASAFIAQGRFNHPPAQ